MLFRRRAPLVARLAANRCCSTAAAPIGINAIRFNQALQKLDVDVIPASELAILLESHGLTSTHLDALENAGAIFRLGSLVHLHPAALVADADHIAQAAAGSSSSPSAAAAWDPCASLREELCNVETAMEQAEPAYREVVAKAARRRKTVWGAAVAAGGTQLAVISRLTYFDLDWDIMEPVSYFLGTGTSLAFFAYMIKYGAECTPKFFDSTLTGRFAKEDAVVKYLELRDRREELLARIAAKEKWFATAALQ